MKTYIDKFTTLHGYFLKALPQLPKSVSADALDTIGSFKGKSFSAYLPHSSRGHWRVPTAPLTDLW